MELDAYRDRLSGYTELRVQRNVSRQVTLVNGNVVQNSASSRAGVSARVWDGGCWGFASGGDAGSDAVDLALGTARANARFLASRGRKDLGELPGAVAAPSVRRFETRRSRWSDQEVITFVREMDAWIAETFPQLQSRMVSLMGLDMEKQLLTSAGARSDSLIPRTLLYVRLAMEREGEPFLLAEAHGGFGQVEDAFLDLDGIRESIRRQVEHLERKTHAVHAVGGTHTVVLDADLAGILAHEAIGHTTEGDLVLGGSVAGDRLGQLVASPLVSLVDYAHDAFGAQCPVPVWVDDEGSEAADVPIIVDGELRAFMHSRETALRLGHAPTGNARAFDFDDEPLVRMRNTSIVPGTSKLEDLIASVDDGYYLMRPSNGQADSTSEFMFGVVLGYEIKNGRIGRAIRDTTISGVAFDVLQSVRGVSDDLRWQCAGMCGKKQPIPVGMGGPALLCDVHVGGV